MRALVTAFVLLLAASPAGASAIYQWQGSGNSTCCSATLEITNEAYAAGAFSLRIDYTGAPRPMPGSPVIHFEMTGYGDRVSFDREMVRGFYDFDVSLVGQSLSGQIRVNDLSIDTLLSGGKEAWTVKNHHADHPGDCFRAENACSGAAGHWVLISPPVE